MKSYAGDPYWLTARRPGACAGCGEPFTRGTRIYWYPRQRRAYSGPCADAAARDFTAHAQDEEMYSR